METARAAGKSKPDLGGAPPPPALSTPNPVREVRMTDVGTVAFNLPNGSRVDIGADLARILGTATTEMSPLRPTEGGPAGDACGRYLEVRAAVTTFELEVARINVKVGYNPGGPLTPAPITGEVDVKLGTVAMDFSVWECQVAASGERPPCSAVVASTSSRALAGVEAAFKFDFSQATVGAHLIWNTPLADALRRIMNDGMKRLAASTRFKDLPWQAVVEESNADIGTVIVHAGRRDGLAAHQSLAVYMPTDAGVCDVFKVVAYARTKQVDEVSSVATLEQSFASRGVAKGDVVMVRVLTP